MANDMKYWDNGFPIATEDGETTISMKYWDSGFPFGIVGVAAVPSSQIGDVDRLARASIGNFNGLALANIGNINGLS